MVWMSCSNDPVLGKQFRWFGIAVNDDDGDDDDDVLRRCRPLCNSFEYIFDVFVCALYLFKYVIP